MSKEKKKIDFSKYPKFEFVKREYVEPPQYIKSADYFIKKCFMQTPSYKEAVECLKKLYSDYENLYNTLNHITLEDMEKSTYFNKIEIMLEKDEKFDDYRMVFVGVLKSQCSKEMDRIQDVIENLCMFLRAKEKQKELDEVLEFLQRSIPEKSNTFKQTISVQQDLFCESKEIFRELLRHLAIRYNGFVDQKSADNWEAIYNDHFSGKELSSDQNRINWTGTWASYDYFYKIFKEFFSRPSSVCVFFSHHYLFHGQYKERRHVLNGIHSGKLSEDDKNKLDDIQKYIKSIRKSRM